MRGKNVYPQDVELTGEQAACGLLRLNCSAAFQSHLPDGGGELDAADMVCEVKQRGIPAGQLAAACEAMAASIRAEHALRLRKLVLLVPRSVPKTTSGKIRRKEARRVLESGALMKRALMVWEDAGVEPTRRSNCDGDGEGGDDGLGEEVDELVEVEDKSFGSFLKVTLAESCLATGIEEEKVDVDVHSPAEMGIESVAAATLCQRLSVRLGTEASHSFACTCLHANARTEQWDDGSRSRLRQSSPQARSASSLPNFTQPDMQPSVRREKVQRSRWTGSSIWGACSDARVCQWGLKMGQGLRCQGAGSQRFHWRRRRGRRGKGARRRKAKEK